MRVLHTSDLHGRYKELLAFDELFDVWLDTGDFCPNKPLRGGGLIEPATEQGWQSRWLSYKQLPHRLADWLGGRPAVVCSGNHDFIRLCPRFRMGGCDAHEVTPEGFELGGLRWAGFPEILYYQGRWAREVPDERLRVLTRNALATRPDVLVTHEPPAGILASQEEYGSPAMREELDAAAERPRAHFFGHDHSCGGRDVEQLGIHFYNGATHLRVVELP